MSDVGEWLEVAGRFGSGSVKLDHNLQKPKVNNGGYAGLKTRATRLLQLRGATVGAASEAVAQQFASSAKGGR